MATTNAISQMTDCELLTAYQQAANAGIYQAAMEQGDFVPKGDEIAEHSVESLGAEYARRYAIAAPDATTLSPSWSMHHCPAGWVWEATMPRSVLIVAGLGNTPLVAESEARRIAKDRRVSSDDQQDITLALVPA